MTDKELGEIEEAYKNNFEHCEIYPDSTTECEYCQNRAKSLEEVEHEPYCKIGHISALLAEVKRLKEQNTHRHKLKRNKRTGRYDEECNP